MRFAFIAKHRSVWPVSWLCEALDVSRSGFHESNAEFVQIATCHRNPRAQFNAANVA